MLQDNKYFLVGVWDGSDWATYNDAVNQPIVYYENHKAIVALMDGRASTKHVSQHHLYWTGRCSGICNSIENHKNH